MNSRKSERERLHRIATQEAREMGCLICGREPAVPAHWPHHRGMGSGKAGWGPDEWLPLCPRHHDLIDGRLGVSPHVENCRHWAIRQLEDAIERRET